MFGKNREPVALAPTSHDYFVPVDQSFATKDSVDLIDVQAAKFDVTIGERLLCDVLVFNSLITQNVKTDYWM